MNPEMTPRDYLTARLALAEGATGGEWTILSKENGDMDVIAVDGEFEVMIPDAAITRVCRKVTLDVGRFIADARTSNPLMAKALLAVVDLHVMASYCSHELKETFAICKHCPGVTYYPCPTVRAITDALGADK